MLVHTSVSGHVFPITVNPPAAYLYDFDIDGDKLKPDHTKWLDQNVVDSLMKSAVIDWNLFLEGTASYTGDLKYNVGLSERRAEQVSKYLSGKLSGKKLFTNATAFGYTKASMAGKKFGVEDARDRAVTVLVQEKTKPKPPPIPHPKLIIPEFPKFKFTFGLDDEFKIRLVGSASGGISWVVGDVLYFEIWALNRKQSAFYIYTGLGFAKGTPVSVTYKGPWNKFWTVEKGNTMKAAPIALDSFEGFARFTTGGTLSKTLNTLNILGLPKGVALFPNDPLEIETGTTIGAGISTSIGGLTWTPRQTFPRFTEI